MNRLYLASLSPRRSQLLKQIGVVFDIIPIEIDESSFENELPQDLVKRLSFLKASKGMNLLSENKYNCVISADTVVVVDGLILGKPQSKKEVWKMLRLLSGKTHTVYTGVCVIGNSRKETIYVGTKVKFRKISLLEIERYSLTGEPYDKAGAYAIQGLGAAFIEKIDGDYSSVVGLPLAETAKILSNFSISYLNKL